MGYGWATSIRTAVTLTTSARPQKLLLSFDHNILIENNRRSSIYPNQIHCFEAFHKLLFDGQSDRYVLCYGVIRSTGKSTERLSVTNGSGYSGETTEVHTSLTFYDAWQKSVSFSGGGSVAFQGATENLVNEYDIDIA